MDQTCFDSFRFIPCLPFDDLCQPQNLVQQNEFQIPARLTSNTSIVVSMTSHMVSRGRSCARLGCPRVLLARGDTRQAVFQEVMALKPVRGLHAGLVAAGAERQEWLVCSHDATYQVLFSSIGQAPMQQKHGESHALHNVLDRSGAVPGFSLQRTEGPAQFRAAMEEEPSQNTIPGAQC